MHKIIKPRDCTMQEFVIRLFEMNEWLSLFPLFNANQKLPTGELLNRAGFTVPKPGSILWDCMFLAPWHIMTKVSSSNSVRDASFFIGPWNYNQTLATRAIIKQMSKEIWKNAILHNEELLREKPMMMMVVNPSGVSILEILPIVWVQARMFWIRVLSCT